MKRYANWIEKNGSPAYGVGEQVLVNMYGTMATVTRTEWHNERGGEYWYWVKFDQPVTNVATGEVQTESAFGCFGLTTSYDENGREVYDADYYRKSLFEFPWENTKEYHFDEVVVVSKRTMGTWFVKVGSGRTETMTLDEVSVLLARLYREQKAA